VVVSWAQGLEKAVSERLVVHCAQRFEAFAAAPVPAEGHRMRSSLGASHSWGSVPGSTSPAHRGSAILVGTQPGSTALHNTSGRDRETVAASAATDSLLSPEPSPCSHRYKFTRQIDGGHGAGLDVAQGRRGFPLTNMTASWNIPLAIARHGEMRTTSPPQRRVWRRRLGRWRSDCVTRWPLSLLACERQGERRRTATSNGHNDRSSDELGPRLT
jgi:hypothetical protein